MKNILFLLIACAFLCQGCNYSMTMVHTQGQAEDVVDDTATNTPSTQVTPTITLPMGGL